ncbi:MAG: Hsp70 family protein [Mycobacterium sp.]|uniref:Hsp70 family protein n=1 Tax=Mycobacterium sp. TaxID=1785 RepID=UPI003F9CF718
MSYGLGVDLGTTFTAAAVAHDGRIEMATLGDHTDAVPSVVLIRDDGTVLTGGAAERRATAEPDRVARAVKRRFGDPMPVILGGAPHPATALIAHQLRAVVDVVSDREGGRPGMVTLTHPANWGPYKCELFAQVPGMAGLGEVHMLTEPEAAAAHYAHNDRLDPGALVAVYDLGGGTFDATVLRTTEHGFDILGRPEGIEGLGGIDFDEAVFTHVDQTLDGAVSRLDPADPRATSAAIRLRRECVTAKETLSADTETTIPVLLPELQTEVRLTRGEFEKMIRPAIGATIASLRRALQSAQIDPPQLHTVLLVGGSSRIPMVAHLVSAELGRPTSVDTHPKHAIALGAAAVGADTTGVGAAAIAATALGRLTPPPADKAGLAAASAPVAPLAAGAAAPALAAPAGDRLRWWRGRNASSLVHDGDGQPEQDPRQPSDDQSPTHPRQRRLPLVIGVLAAVAVLAGGGTAAYRALAASTPTTSHQPLLPVSHQSSDTRRTPGTVIAPSTPIARTPIVRTPIARTTVAPTTVAPTTVAPTTVAPTTVAPTTVAPTTVAPTTVAPTTVAPTTVAPTTVAPTTPLVTPGSQAATP